MNNKKKLAIFIQVFLLITIATIGFFTYRAVERDNLDIESKQSLLGEGACPAIKKRACVEESYTANPIFCKVQPDECNSQDNLKTCYQYTWKENRKVSYCRMCGGNNVDWYNDRTLVVCNPKK